MGEIKIETAYSIIAYDAMIKLHDEWVSAIPKIPESTEASGSVAEQLVLLGTECQRLSNIMSDLLEYTAQYIKNINEEFVKTDEDIASRIDAN